MQEIIQGDCIQVMKGMEANSVDTVITDPPYGIGFMGKEWDTFKKDFIEKNTKRSGWKDWHYESGQSHTSPAKEAGTYDQSLEGHNKFQKWTEEWAREALRVTKPGGTMLCFAGTRTQHRVTSGIEDAGWILKDCIMWLYGSGFPKATDISKQLDKGHERNIAKKTRKDTGFRMQAGGTESLPPVLEEAKLWNGWKSHGLKPAYEPIIVAMKPNEGTYAQNALKHGVSGLNIDGGRIKTTDNRSRDNSKVKPDGFFKGKKRINQVIDNDGRFPANIILDEEAAKMLDEQSGELKQGVAKRKNLSVSHFGHKAKGLEDLGYSDKGGASRFFYTAKASKSERNMGLEEFEEKEIEGDVSLRQQGVHGQTGKPNKPLLSKNHHPTVKPLALMEYLCTLTKTPTGGIVLDPFAGSGTTGLAAKNTGRDYILIEKEEEYVKIAEARLKTKQRILV